MEAFMRLSSFLAAALLLPAASLSHADVAAGKSRAQMACAVCHGQVGLSTQPNVPHLAGQPRLYLVEQLRNYRSGKRHHEVMSVIARPLSDEEIHHLSDWYASLILNVEEK
jgi:cytochrome c553